jgi:DNA polymerase-1
MALKKFSADYRMPLELPHDDDIVAYLEPRGFDFSGVNVDYVLDFVPMADGFAVDLRNLRKLAASRYLLSAIPYGQRRVFPLVDCFGSITSRIYFRDPSLQNLAKRHRDIVLPDPGFILSYVDYDQYEVGIMAALSGDPLLMSLYSAGDLYQSVAEKLFGDASRRKQAKRLFLSYAYGMKFKALVDAAAGFGARRTAARDFFRGFSVFEEWKLEIYSRFKKTNAIGTSLGNYLVRDPVGELSDREKRSSVSQVVQGTASLIFKKALLAISRDARLELKIPMHDAVLVQHRPDYEITDLVNIFSQTMTEHFEGRLQGKASLDSFTAG